MFKTSKQKNSVCWVGTGYDLARSIKYVSRIMEIQDGFHKS